MSPEYVPKPLVCPRLKCRAPATEITLYSTDLETRRYFSDHTDEEGTPLYDDGSWVHTEWSEQPDAATCRRCGHEWTPRPGSYDFG